MEILKVRNVQHALPEGIRLLEYFGNWQDSRNGRVVSMPCPVTTVYSKPTERVLFWDLRNANPFFHLMESFWMLGGREDVEWLVKYNKRMAEYSDDGEIFYGAYGFRWRKHFSGEDQLQKLITLLRNNSNTRRAVLSIWDAKCDLQTSESGFKDLPCLSGNTSFMSPEGSVTLTELERKFTSGEISKFPVLSLDRDTFEIKLNWCTSVWKSGVKKVVRIHFDDSTYLDCTEDHKIYSKKKLYRGDTVIELKEAGSLKVGDRVWATSFKEDPKGYLMVKKKLKKNNSFNNYSKLHRDYYELVNGPLSVGEVVHHIDDDKKNNSLLNLEKMSESEHNALHRMGDLNPMHTMTKEQHRKRAEKHSRSLKKYWKDKKDSERVLELDNHKIIKIEVLSEQQQVYDFTVPGTHNAFLGNGVLVSNCNTQVYYRCMGGSLHQTILNRSNDIIWGKYGANAVHFSMLHEYMARMTNCKVGTMTHVSNNYHAYEDLFNKLKPLSDKVEDGHRTSTSCPYVAGAVKVQRLIDAPLEFDKEVELLLKGDYDYSFANDFISLVAVPIARAWDGYKNNTGERRYKEALHWIYQMPEQNDWRKAAERWIQIKYSNFLANQ